jgi:DNA-binding MarR family transcriptional regulator
LTPFNLTQPSFSILTIVGWQAKQNIASVSSSHVRQKVVVDMSGMPKMQVSLILQRLKKSKLINISPYLLDLREQQVELTRDGKERLAKTICLVEVIDEKYLPMNFINELERSSKET